MGKASRHKQMVRQAMRDGTHMLTNDIQTIDALAVALLDAVGIAEQCLVAVESGAEVTADDRAIARKQLDACREAAHAAQRLVAQAREKLQPEGTAKERP